MNAYPLAALAAIVLLVGAVLWRAVDGLDPVLLPPPKYRGEAVVMVEVQAPHLGDLKSEFNINDINPFIPFSLREAEARTVEQRGKGGQGPVKIKTPPPPKPPDPLVLPPKAVVTAQAPVAKGLLSDPASQRVNVLIPGSSSAAWIDVGETRDGWTLQTIQEGNVAVFVDGTGRTHPVIISPGDLKAPARAATASRPANNPGPALPPGAGQIPPGALRPPTTPPTTAPTSPESHAGGASASPQPMSKPLGR